LALEEVNKKIQAFEAKKAALTVIAAGTGVKALGATNELAQIENSPEKDELNKALITAEAAVRIASKKFGGSAGGGSGSSSGSSDGALWWMNRDLEEKKKRYAPAAKK